MKLYSYFRSSAAFRVRIALNLKNLSHDMSFVHMTKDGGQHKLPVYRTINPQGRIPSLVLDSGETLIQSLAIIEYLDEVHPDPPFLPANALQRARARAVAQIVACDMHPVNNSMVLGYLRGPLSHGEDEINTWYAHWIREGFDAIEQLIHPGPYAFGPHVTLADICLVPQVFNARRYQVPLDAYPKIVGVEAACLKLPAFDKARPERQPDFE